MPLLRHHIYERVISIIHRRVFILSFRQRPIAVVLAIRQRLAPPYYSNRFIVMNDTRAKGMK